MFERRAYLLDVTDRCPTERLLQELVDILVRYRYNEFFLHRGEGPCTGEFAPKLARLPL